MIVGDPKVFAIESQITRAYERLSLLALGFFAIHVGGRRYGVCEPEATMLACSFGEVERRLRRRGGHTAPFSTEADAGKIADAFRQAIFAEEQDEHYFGIPVLEFRSLFSSNDLFPTNSIRWAPDGDAAFDDSSYVLQFDVDDRVRLIAFRCGEGYGHDPTTLSDVWLPAGAFYKVLHQWHDAFAAEWASLPKE
jgi:hypothetical protein